MATLLATMASAAMKFVATAAVEADHSRVIATVATKAASEEEDKLLNTKIKSIC